ncbi:hypothetical protein OPT61_g8668 [Boeremia exigua]|uniref:Uncharacterized protein n=1 Tax=Boeremia exigua TaxID=749465 RepID=A0ACC2HXD6_9PLEO|nr:hypothetical protein OPT61_g8668 [Boeremia exigua]
MYNSHNEAIATSEFVDIALSTTVPIPSTVGASSGQHISDNMLPRQTMHTTTITTTSSSSSTSLLPITYMLRGLRVHPNTAWQQGLVNIIAWCGRTEALVAGLPPDDRSVCAADGWFLAPALTLLPAVFDCSSTGWERLGRVGWEEYVASSQVWEPCIRAASVVDHGLDLALIWTWTWMGLDGT